MISGPTVGPEEGREGKLRIGQRPKCKDLLLVAKFLRMGERVGWRFPVFNKLHTNRHVFRKIDQFNTWKNNSKHETFITGLLLLAT